MAVSRSLEDALATEYTEWHVRMSCENYTAVETYLAVPLLREVKRAYLVDAEYTYPFRFDKSDSLFIVAAKGPAAHMKK